MLAAGPWGTLKLVLAPGGKGTALSRQAAGPGFTSTVGILMGRAFSWYGWLHGLACPEADVSLLGGEATSSAS